MSVLWSDRAGPIDRSVLLFSGGMDSLCAAALYQPDVLLRVVQPNRYSTEESLSMARLQQAGFFDEPSAHAVGSELVTLSGVLDLAEWERDDFIVPNRNAHLVLLASNYGDSIWLGAINGDRPHDKDEAFCDHMVALLNHMHSEQLWTSERKFSVTLPIRHLTKTQLVREFLAAGHNAEWLHESWSCYTGTQPGTPSWEAKHCGVCKACFRKRVALINNDVDGDEGYWLADWWDTDWWQVIKSDIAASEYRGGDADAEVMEAMERVSS